MDIALIAVDLDGTLLTSERALAPEGARALVQAAQSGVRVVLATTRNPGSVREFCRALQIDDPIICTSGAQVWASPDGPPGGRARLGDQHNHRRDHLLATATRTAPWAVQAAHYGRA